MKKILTAAATVSGAALLVLATAAPAGAIVGGAPDEGEHPYVGQLLFYVPDAPDPRFTDPGGWFTCTGTLIDADTVITAGHCTYDVGLDGVAPADPLGGGNDVWFSVEEVPDFSVLPPSSGFVPDRNAERYEAWAGALDASPTWYAAETVWTHPEYDDASFFLHDVGMFQLAEPIVLDSYAELPTEGYLDQYQRSARNDAVFETVGYGLEGSGPKTSFGGDTRMKADRYLVSLNGVYGYRDIVANFSHSPGRGGGTCFGDSGGPTFDNTGTDGTGTVLVTVTSFGMTLTCTTGGYYRIDQPDDLEFIASHL